MLNLVARIFLIAAGAIVSLFIAEDAPNYSFVQSVTGMVLFVAFVAVCSFWPRRWLPRFSRKA